MKTVNIEYKVSPTEKEIYSFTQSGDTYIYSGIMYSNRDDNKDKWGEVWGEDDREEAIKDLHQMDRDEEMPYWFLGARMNIINEKYNPCCNKTIHGKVRHHGESWGYGHNKDKPIPKLDRKQLEALIIKKIVKIKVVGVN